MNTKLIRLIALATITIGLVSLLVATSHYVQHVQGMVFGPADAPKCIGDGPAGCQKKPHPELGSALNSKNTSLRREQLAASSRLTGKESALRIVSSVGVSVSVLMGGLLCLGWSLRKSARQLRGMQSEPLRRRRNSRLRWSLAFPAIAALVGSVVLFEAVVKPRVSSAQQSPEASANSLTPDAQIQQGKFRSAILFGGPSNVPSDTTQVGGTAIDKSGNTYVTGGFVGSVVFNTQPAGTTLTSTKDDDFYLAKFGPADN